MTTFAAVAFFRLSWRMLAIFFTVSTIGGCAFAPVAVEAAGPAVDFSMHLTRAGKFESYQPVSMDEMIAATHKAAEKLQLIPVEEKKKSDVEYDLVYKDERKQEIDITIVKRTPSATAVLVDVGWFGPAGLGRLVMRQLLHELPESPSPEQNELQEGG